jgi:hypothetical protein
MTRTVYLFEVACNDLGEYDAIFLGEIASLIARELKDSGVVGFSLSTSRRRPEESEHSK